MKIEDQRSREWQGRDDFREWLKYNSVSIQAEMTWRVSTDNLSDCRVSTMAGKDFAYDIRTSPTERKNGKIRKQQSVEIRL